MAFLIGHDESAVGVDADAVRCAKTVGDNVGPRAVAAHSQQRAVMWNQRFERMAGRFRVIEIALCIGLQAHGEFVEVFGHLVVVVEVFEVVDLSVAVQVVQDADLIATGDVDFALNNLHAQLLKQTGRDPPPLDLDTGAIDSGTSSSSPPSCSLVRRLR